MARGEKYTREIPCKTCGGSQFYVSSECCVACAMTRSRAQSSGARQEGIPPEFAREAARERKAQALRLAEIRARKTAHQRRCLGLTE